MGAVANVQANIVQLLACGTTVAVALRQISKSFGAIPGIVLSQGAVSGTHIRRDAAIQQPLLGVQATAARMSQETVAAQDMLTRFSAWQGGEPWSVAADATYGNGEFLTITQLWLSTR